jgi:hypothetical protein
VICGRCTGSGIDPEFLDSDCTECDGFGKLAHTAVFHRPQPDPKHNDKPAVWDLVLADMAARDQLGYNRYGTRLQPHNGRDTLRDAYDEALDLAVYLRSALYERDGK